MASIRKPNTSQLLETLTWRSVDNMQAAEDFAQAFMKLSYNRNLLQHRELMTHYVAAAIYTLAHSLPVPVAEYTDPVALPVRYRSKVGDIPHLIVLLSYSPATVLELVSRNGRVSSYLGGFVTAADTDKLKQLAANMNRLILEGVLIHFSAMAFSLRVEKWAVAPVAQPVPHHSLSMAGLTAKAILVRCTCDLRLMIEDSQWTKNFTLANLGSRFRAMRMSIDMSQRQFAEEIGISKVAYTRMESGTKISAETLFRCLLYYSRIINLDVIFDKRLWELAQQDQELLFKKVHISSVVHRKHQLLKESLMQDITEIRSALDKRMDMLLYGFENGINSILSLTEE